MRSISIPCLEFSAISSAIPTALLTSYILLLRDLFHTFPYKSRNSDQGDSYGFAGQRPKSDDVEIS